MEETSHCHKPNCSWLQLPRLTGLQDVPGLVPNPELSGIGVILGFSISAYLTVALLIFHYVTVYDPHRVSPRGHEYINPVDRSLLTFVRHQIIAWTPSRRFEYAMEKSVLILSDAQLVTGLAILIAGYSQLDCGITAYHWQIMVFVAWFSSFTFLSAMAFFERYFQTNNNLRIIRVYFMCLLGGLLITALLPTGSRNWLDLFHEGGGFYPSLGAMCYFEQLTMPTFVGKGPRIWSMVFSILVVGLSYLHSGIKLFDPTAEFTRKYMRTIPGAYVKRVVRLLERKSTQIGFRAALWTPPYFIMFAAFSSARAVYDIAESMLAEIIWLSFAIAWGTLKVWSTRSYAAYNIDGENVNYNMDVLQEDSWSFGQTLPLVLLLLPVLSMAQTYLDNDARAQEVAYAARVSEKRETPDECGHLQTANLSGVRIAEREKTVTNPRNSTSCDISRCQHHQPSLDHSRTGSTTLNGEETSYRPSSGEEAPPVPPRSPLRPESPTRKFGSRSPQLPRYPYRSFFDHHWYRDHVSLLVCQIIMLGSVILWVQDILAQYLGISAILRSRLFLIWIFAFIPFSSLIHLMCWYLAACIVCRIDGAEDWLEGKGRYQYKGEDKRWWKRTTRGQFVYWLLRFLLKGGCMLFTFLVSAEAAGPSSLPL